MIKQEPEVKHDFRDLFTDGNLFSIFKVAPSIFATPINAVLTIFTVLFLTAFVTWRYTHEATHSHPDFVQTFASWATVGWTLSSTLLGFLIAGFALLCTALTPSAIVALHKYQPNAARPNYLRELFIFFVDIFINYICLLFFSIAVVLLTSQNGMFLELKSVLLLFGPNIPLITGDAVYVLWGTWFVVSVLKLKSFVYNLYQALLYAMTERVHHEESEAEKIARELVKLLSPPDR